MIKLIILLLSFNFANASVPLKDNILFGFEKCKALAVDLENGQLKEAVSSSFDLHCKKKDNLEFSCDYFDTGSNKVLKIEEFSGGSDLGVGELKNTAGNKIRFLIGKTYASYEAVTDHKVCIGIYLFEQDALKKKAP